MKNALCKKDVAQLSGSTLAWMLRDLGYTGESVTYTLTDAITRILLDYCDTCGKTFKTWQDCYNSFKKSVKNYTRLWLLEYGLSEESVDTLLRRKEFDVNYGKLTLTDGILTVKLHTTKEPKVYRLMDGFIE